MFKNIFILTIFYTFVAISIVSAQGAEKKDLKFSQIEIANNSNMWWARAFGDINNDGLLDVALIDNNAFGGWIGWLEGTLDTSVTWKQHKILDSLKDGRRFASGDLEVADFDNDGDVDIIAPVHTGEWKQGAKYPTEIYWLENPSWEMHRVGIVPNFIKDISVADFNDDGKMDIATVNYKLNILTIFYQLEDGSFDLTWQQVVENLHEGMDVAEVNGDKFIDIVANGYWLKNPGIPTEKDWELLNIDSIWYNQTGDWSKNATKVACYDFDGDSKSEVVVTHSEREGYPLTLYKLIDVENNIWSKEILLKEIIAAQNLVIADFDLDGRMDVLTGANRGRAKMLGQSDYPVYILLNKENGWEALKINNDGIYNAQAVDYDNDGDVDIFRYSSHDSKNFEIMINHIK